MTKTDNTDLSDIIELVEYSDYKKANKYLESGWILLSTHIVDFGHPVERHQNTVYCLGWSRKLGNPKYY